MATLDETVEWYLEQLSMSRKRSIDRYAMMIKLLRHQEVHIRQIARCNISPFADQKWRDAAADSNVARAVYQQHALENQGNVFSFYDRPQYSDEGMADSHAQFQANRFVESMQGGESIRLADSLNKEFSHSRPYPQGIKNPPSRNIIVATNQNVVSHGGYFGAEEEGYAVPISAHILIASDIEFETFSLEALRNEDCPYITTVQSDNNVALDPLNTDASEARLYLNTAAYKAQIKQELINKLKSALAAHHQSVNPSQDLQFNIALPGMGFFAKVAGKNDLSIARELAAPAAEAYREALSEFAEFQNNSANVPEGFGKIKAFRLVRSKSSAKFDASHEQTAIDKAFYGHASDDGLKLNGIDIIANADGVENYTKCQKRDDGQPVLKQVSVVAGDVRAQAGNEKGMASQEPAVFSHVPGLRALCCIHQNPFFLATQKAFFIIDQWIGKRDDGEIKGRLDNVLEHLENLNNMPQVLPTQDIVTSLNKANAFVDRALESIKSYLSKYHSKEDGATIKGSKGHRKHAFFKCGDEGRLRAEFFQAILQDPAVSLVDKLTAVYALLVNKHGSSLRKCSSEQIGARQQGRDLVLGSKNQAPHWASQLKELIETIAQYKHEHDVFDYPSQSDQQAEAGYQEFVENLLQAANDGRDLKGDYKNKARRINLAVRDGDYRGEFEATHGGDYEVSYE